MWDLNWGKNHKASRKTIYENRLGWKREVKTDVSFRTRKHPPPRKSYRNKRDEARVMWRHHRKPYIEMQTARNSIRYTSPFLTFVRRQRRFSMIVYTSFHMVHDYIHYSFGLSAQNAMALLSSCGTQREHTNNGDCSVSFPKPRLQRQKISQTK